MRFHRTLRRLVFIAASLIVTLTVVLPASLMANLIGDAFAAEFLRAIAWLAAVGLIVDLILIVGWLSVMTLVDQQRQRFQQRRRRQAIRRRRHRRAP